MRKFFFLLILLFPSLTFGQSFVGNYRAVFFNLFSEPRTVVAEFEVKQDNSVVGKVKVGNEFKTFSGTVDKKGKFEVVSEPEGNTVYKLKGKFDKDKKISFVQRVQVGSGLNKSVSENGLEGTFAKIEKIVETKPPVVTGDGKNQLQIQQSNPIFGTSWTTFTARVISKKDNNGIIREIEISEKNEIQERRLQILTRPSLPTEKFWKLNGIDIAYTTYKEQNRTTGERNSFTATSDTYKNNSILQDGIIEIVSEDEAQVVFKLTMFRIKRLGKDDFVELNGFIYANK